MKITVTDGKTKKSHIFREGLPACELIAQSGFNFSMPCGGNGRCGKCRCIINGQEALACNTLIFTDSVIEIPQNEAHVLTADKEERVDGANGSVIDIGTTTVAAALFKDGVPVKTIGFKNPQCSFGGDVISRIGAKDTSPLTRSIQALVKKIRSDFGGKTVITGNTAMLSLLCGLDVREMGVYPFSPPSLFDADFEGAYLPPCISAFVGADALCSVLWSEADRDSKTALIMDLGTNGEICLKHNDKFYFTSAAAGPAMEGASISCGMAAAEGAVYRVNKKGISVIGDGIPKGLCGSGLVDAIAMFIEEGKIDRFAAAEAATEIHSSGLFITREDIRSFQLCKAAVAAAAKTLLSRLGLSVHDLDKIYLSGALGKNLNIENAVKLGLLPPADPCKFTSVGNGALLGGAMLLNEDSRRRIRDMAAKSESVNLGADPEFMKRYIENMNF